MGKILLSWSVSTFRKIWLIDSYQAEQVKWKNFIYIWKLGMSLNGYCTNWLYADYGTKHLSDPTTGDVDKREPTKNWVSVIEDIIKFLHFKGNKETQKTVYVCVPIPN